jgi:hypothetical protein
VPVLNTSTSLHAMAQNQHMNSLPRGRRKRDMSFHKKINMAFIKIRITKSWTQINCSTERKFLRILNILRMLYCKFHSYNQQNLKII